MRLGKDHLKLGILFTIALSSALAYLFMVPLRSSSDISPATSQNVREALIASGKFLQRHQQKDGSFIYQVDAKTGKTLSDENIVHQVGSNIALWQLYQLTKDQSLREACTKHLQYLLNLTRPGIRDSELVISEKDAPVKLGALGLMLGAISQQLKEESSETLRSDGRRIAAAILRMQHPDGTFESYYPANTSSKVLEPHMYDIGETLLGLTMFYKVDPDKRWLHAAQEGANAVINAQKRHEPLPEDAWLIQALDELHAITPSHLYAEHANALADRILRDRKIKFPDGKIIDSSWPHTNSSLYNAALMEGLGAAYRIAKRVGDDKSAEKWGKALTDAAAILVYWQINPRSIAWDNLDKASTGGIADTKNIIRTDYMMHMINALLATLPALESEGK